MLAPVPAARGLAAQAFGPAAATVAGIFGVLMLVVGAGTAHGGWLSR